VRGQLARSRRQGMNDRHAFTVPRHEVCSERARSRTTWLFRPARGRAPRLGGCWRHAAPANPQASEFR
jgi:hypothetical protein